MPPGWAASLICRDSIAEDFTVAYRITSLAAAIGGVSFYGINPAVFYFLHDTHMIRLPV